MLVINSNEWLLTMIWRSSIALGTLSLCLFFLFVIQRIFDSRKRQQLAIQKQIFYRYLYATVNSPITISKKDLPELTLKKLPLIREIALDILRITQGRETQQLVQIVKIWDVPNILYCNLS